MSVVGVIILALLIAGFELVYTGWRGMDGTAEEQMGGSLVSLAGWALIGGAVLLMVGGVFVKVFFG